MLELFCGDNAHQYSTNLIHFSQLFTLDFVIIIHIQQL